MATNSKVSLNGSHKSNGSSGLLKHEAYVELKARFIKGTYSPGTFLAERTLAAELGMSKTPVKAALERLEQEGFISVSPQQGIVVRELTLEEIVDHYEIRLALEGYVLRTVAGHLTAAQIEQLEANLKCQAENEPKSDHLRAVQLDAEFHMLPSEFLGNREILRVLRQLVDKTHRVILRVFRMQPNRVRDSVREHRKLSDAVIQGDGERAAQLLEQHLERGRRLILAPRVRST